MTPSHAKKNGARYRYYVSCVLAQGRKAEAGSLPRVPAPEIEAAVVAALRQPAEDSGPQDHWSATTPSDPELVHRGLDRVTVSRTELRVHLSGQEGTILLPWSGKPATRRREILRAQRPKQDIVLPIKAEERARILRAIARARAWLNELVSGQVTSTDEIARREGISERSVRSSLNLARLSPEIVKATVHGRLPRGIGLGPLCDLPLDWNEQRSALGIR